MNTHSLMTLSEWIENYIQIINKQDLKLKTVENKKSILKKVSSVLGGRPIGLIKTYDLFNIVESYVLRDKTTQAVIAFQLINDLFRKAYSRGIIDINPATPLEKPINKVKRDRLTLDDFKRMLHVSRVSAPEWFFTALVLALVTAQRRGDLAKMRYDDIKDGYLYITQQKTGAKIALPLNLRLNVIGTSLHEVLFMCSGGEYLLSKNGKKVSVHMLTTWFAKIRDLAEIPVTPGKTPPSFHEIRALSEQLYEEQNVDTRTLLGHKSHRTTCCYNDRRGKSYKKLVFY